MKYTIYYKAVLAVCCFSIVTGLLVSCNSTLRQVKTFHLNDEGEIISREFIKESYYVDRRTKKREGEYVEYGRNWMPIREGNYIDGRKVGTWKSLIEEDGIWKYTNFDSSEISYIEIPKDYLKYPMILAEEMDSIPSGLLKIDFKFSEECILQNAIISQRVHPKLDSIILSRFIRYMKLKTKYRQDIEECATVRDSTIVINFIGK